MTSAPAMRRKKTSLWGLTARGKIARHDERHRNAMIPDKLLAK